MASFNSHPLVFARFTAGAELSYGLVFELSNKSADDFDSFRTTIPPLRFRWKLFIQLCNALANCFKPCVFE